MLRYINGAALAAWVCFAACTPEPIPLTGEDRLAPLPEIPLSPPDNLPNPDKILLGKMLFWDPILSGKKDVACVTCHHPQDGYAERLDLSLGVGGNGLSASRIQGTLVKRNSMTILNTAFNGINAYGDYDPETAEMFWDNRSQSLEEQAIQPILSAEEMRGAHIDEEAILDTVVQRLAAIPTYRALFLNAFGDDSITVDHIGKAIAAFERTLIANQSKFDRYMRGEPSAMSSLELRGMTNFIQVGCAACHNGPMFSDFELHVLTVPENPKLAEPDSGDGAFAFRTPTLRNLELTAPYMHNGVFETLEEVIDFYDDVDAESQNPLIPSSDKDPELSNLNLADDKIASIIAFLNCLNDEDFDKEVPQSVPSQLPPGGNIK
ncbi:MAG: cytochrome c peroxidase [Bacteroidota bacterium]